MTNLKTVEAIDKQTNTKTTIQIEENCCFEFKGKKFCSVGAFISNKYIIGYLTTNKTNGQQQIITWNGELISDKVNITTKLNTRYGELYYLRFSYNGIVYSGAKIAQGDLVRAKATKRKEI